jgi:hypothetical protein
MLRIAATLVCLMLAMPAYAARTVDVDPLININMEALPPICQSALVLPVMNFSYWIARQGDQLYEFDLVNLQRTVAFGVEPAIHACLWQINQRLKQVNGGP